MKMELMIKCLRNCIGQKDMKKKIYSFVKVTGIVKRIDKC